MTYAKLLNEDNTTYGKTHEKLYNISNSIRHFNSFSGSASDLGAARKLGHAELDENCRLCGPTPENC